MIHHSYGVRHRARRASVDRALYWAALAIYRRARRVALVWSD